jgi:transcription-repair coupling factor (superfamily II helicase)
VLSSSTAGRRLPARQPRSRQRGAGNLLGDEQSGHIKEIGFELYQSMLEEAILEAKAGGRRHEAAAEAFSPRSPSMRRS